MQEIEAFEVIFTEENILIFSLPFRDGKAERPIILYDGGEHAMLYRASGDVLGLNFLPDEAKPILSSSKYAYVLEVDYDNEIIISDYQAPIKIVKQIPMSEKTAELKYSNIE